MQKVDTLLFGGTVVTMNDQYKVLTDGAVAVLDDSISAVGKTSEIKAQYQAEIEVDCRQKAIIPGLVNAHTHLGGTGSCTPGIGASCGTLSVPYCSPSFARTWQCSSSYSGFTCSQRRVVSAANASGLMS